MLQSSVTRRSGPLGHPRQKESTRQRKRRHDGCWLVWVAKNPDLNGLQSSILVMGVGLYTSRLLRNPIFGHLEIVVRL